MKNQTRRIYFSSKKKKNFFQKTNLKINKKNSSNFGKKNFFVYILKNTKKTLKK